MILRTLYLLGLGATVQALFEFFYKEFTNERLFVVGFPVDNRILTTEKQQSSESAYQQSVPRPDRNDCSASGREPGSVRQSSGGLSHEEWIRRNTWTEEGPLKGRE